MADEALDKTMEEQIDEMIDEAPEEEEVVVEETAEVTEEEVEPSEPEAEEVVEEPEEVEDVIEEDTTEEEVEEEEAVEEEVEPESDDVQEFRDRINQIAEAALKQGVQLPDGLFGEVEEEVSVETPTPTPTPTPVPTPPPPSPQSYDEFQILMEGVDFDSFMDNEVNFVQGMRSILARQEQMLSQRFMQAIPNIVQNQTKQIVSLQSAVDKFYKVNNDLEPVRATVGAVATQLETKHPDWSIAQVMDESAKTTRKILRLPNPKGGDPKKVKPSFAKPGKTQQRNKPKIQMSKLQKEIDDLM